MTYDLKHTTSSVKVEPVLLQGFVKTGSLLFTDDVTVIDPAR